MAPTLVPVLGEPGEHQLHETADEIGTLAGRQHQQPRVVDHQRQTPAPLLLGPADKLVAGFDMQRGGAPSSQGQPLASVGGHKTQVFPHQPRVLQVVILSQELIESFHFSRWDRLHLQMDQNLLFIGRGLAKAGSGWFHVRQHK